MKKIILVLLTLCFVPALFLQASAWGGFIAKSGEKTYHTTYCEELYGSEYNKLNWYDTKAKAEAAGLSPCEICDASAWYDFEGLDGTVFITNDRKLDAMFELVLDYGSSGGYESGYETGYADGTCGVEDNDGYGIGYSDGYKKGYASGKEDFVNATYSDGFKEGYDVSKGEQEEKISEIKEEYKTQLEEEKSKFPWIETLVTAVISFFIGKYYWKENCNAEIRKKKYIVYILDLIGKDAKMPLEEVVDALYISYSKAKGISENEATNKLKCEKIKYKL